jgi:Tfp pilus assembly protein PilV
MTGSHRAGCTLVEIVVSLLVFTTGALGLAAGTAVVAREMAGNRVRAEAARLAASRLETTHSTCRVAQSGSETRSGVFSQWTVSALDSTRVRLVGSASYVTARGRRTEPYSATLTCR